MNRDDIHTNINSIQFRGADMDNSVVPKCELLFSTSTVMVYILPCVSHSYSCLLFGYYCSDLRGYFINKRLSKYLLSITS